MSRLKVPPPGFEDLSAEEVPIPDWHRAIIAERLAEARSDTAAVRPWSVVRAQLRERLRGVRGDAPARKGPRTRAMRSK